MKWIRAALWAGILSLAIANPCDAKGGFSSSAGGGSRGGFSSSRSYSSPSYSSPSTRTTTTTTRTYSTNRSYGRGYGYGYGSGYYYHPMMMYPGFGMGYGYSNGLVEGLIIGNLMHPQGTTIYSGGGYNGSALLYPDGRVVDQNGYQVGNYANGQFAPVQNGGMVAQPAPQIEQPVQPPAPAPVIVEQRGPGLLETLIVIALCALGIGLLFVLVRWIVTWPYWDEETQVETVTETTVTSTPGYSPSQQTVSGELVRHRSDGQGYIIDPADRSKTWVNDSDDMYEDAQGRIWRLV